MSGIFSRDASPAESEDEPDMWGELGPPPPPPPLVSRNAHAIPSRQMYVPEVDILANVPDIFFRDETWRKHFTSPDADFVANQERKQTEPDAYELVEKIENLIKEKFITDLPTYVSGLRRSDPVKYELNAGPRVINVRFVIHLLQNFRSIQRMPMVMEDRYRFIIMLRTFLMYIPIDKLYEFLDILFSRTGGRKTKKNKKKKKKKQTRR